MSPIAFALALVVSTDPGATLDRWLVDSGYQGAVLVAENGKVVLRKGYGEADRETHRPYGPDTVFSIGSITKQFTAAAILKLEMEGKLKVGDPIAKYLPGVPEDKSAITIHELLTHTAGLESDFAGDFEAVSRDEYVKRVLASKLRTPPGKEHYYANSGYSLLGAIVEIASGRPYETYLREHLFLPAGMKETGYRLPKWEEGREAVGYRGGERWGRMREKRWAADGPYWALRANGGILSTLDDLYRWHLALEGDRILSAEEKKKMFTPHVAEGPAGESFYGYGWAISTSPWGTREIGHNGGNGIFSADFRTFPDDGIVVITASNVSSVKAWKAAGALARIAHGESVPVPPRVGAPLAALGTEGVDAAARAWFEALQADDPVAAMNVFRAAHASPGGGGRSEAERDRMIRRMHDDLTPLTVEGVVARADGELTVRGRSPQGGTATFRFRFTSDGKLDGVGVELGD